MKIPGLLVTVVMLAACGGKGAGPDFERMIDQQKARAYTEEELLPRASAMQTPPAGTVEYAPAALRAAHAAHPEIASGVDATGHDLAVIPLAITSPLLKRGEERFNIFCAACHGPLGDGQSEVARHMELRKPPTLLDARARAFPAGRIFRVVSTGYGLMPGYARDLPAEDRWAVIGYLRALQLSQAVSLDDLPPSQRRSVEEALR